MSERIVMQPDEAYHPPDYTFRGELMDELGMMFESHDQLPEHSPACEKSCVLGLFFKNHGL
jgi:hypothetical protein